MAWRSWRSWLIGVGLAAALSGCGGGSSGPPAPVPLPPAGDSAAAASIVTSSYKLGSGDRIRLAVFRDETLSGEFTLDGAGNFAMPLLGEVQAGGLSARELEARIRDKLVAEDLLRDPQVSIEILNYRPFYILGEVRAPGSYAFVNGMTVLNAVALAGGFSYRAKQDDFLLQRGGSNVQGAEVSGDTPLLPGDIVTVQERFF